MKKLKQIFFLVIILGINSALFATENTPSVLQVTVETCQQCHEEIYHQWTGSMHAQSSALKDPIHGMFYQQLMGSPTEEGVRGPQIPVKMDKYPVCLFCHAPNAAADQKTKLDAAPSYSQGVSCVSCHSLAEYHGVDDPKTGKHRYGIQAYQQDRTSLYGPKGVTYTPARVAEDASWPTPVHHPIPFQGSKAALFGSNDICMGCHDKRANSNGTLVCLTGMEYQQGKSFVNCQSCHMPIVTVPKLVKGKPVPDAYVSIADHSMSGGHDPKMVTRGVNLEMNAHRNGDTLEVKINLHNRLPHSFPTAAPFRNAFLKVSAHDIDGKVLWQNYQVHPIKDDPQAAFWYKLGDPKTGAVQSSHEAIAVLADSRLAPNETRSLSYKILLSQPIAILRAELWYDLVLPPLKPTLQGKIPAELLKPKLVTSAELRQIAQQD